MVKKVKNIKEKIKRNKLKQTKEVDK